MTWRAWLTTSLLVLVGLLAGAPARATLVLAVPLERMTAESEVIVHARVGDQQVTWDRDHQRILTLTRIEVIEGLKGARKGELLTIYQVGGSLDGVTFAIPGALRFAPGDEMVFFAARFEDKIVSYGMGLGKYAVRDAGGAKLVLPELGDVAFVKRAPDGSLQHDEAPPPVVQPLDDFLAGLRQEIARPTWQPAPRPRTLPRAAAATGGAR